jgi:hypothetical protein
VSAEGELIDQCAEWLGLAEPGLFRMWFDCQVDVTMPDHGGVDTYPDWLEGVSVDWRQAAAEGGLEEVADWLALSGAAVAELDRLRPVCGACGLRHSPGPDECDLAPTPGPEPPGPGTRVTVELWVSDRISDPVRLVRGQLGIAEGADISILDVWADDPE